MYSTGTCREFEIILKHSPYALEINKYLKQKEEERKPYLCRSPQLQFRQKLIETIRSICIKLKLSNVTLHLAVHLLDCFMDNYDIIIDRLNFVALACISLSAKFEQHDGSFPKISHLLSFERHEYPSKDLTKLELMILKFFDWNLALPTTAHFIEYYKWLIVFSSDCSSDESVRCLRKRAFITVTELMNVSLDDYRINKFGPSRVAACCVLSSRRVLKLSPRWPAILEFVTGYNESNLDFCCNFLMSLYRKCHNVKETDSEEENNSSDSGEENNTSNEDINNNHDQDDAMDLGYHSRSSSNPESPEEMS